MGFPQSHGHTVKLEHRVSNSAGLTPFNVECPDWP